MSCLGLFRKRKLPEMPQDGRAASSPKQQGLAALKRLVELTTMVSPTKNGFHKKSGDGSLSTDPGSFELPPLMAPLMRHLARLYDELRGRKPDLSRESFETFLRDFQGGIIEPLDKERYTFAEFLEVWYSQYRAAVRPIDFREKDLTKPISNYFINSSHNTYLLGRNQVYGPNSSYAYKLALRGGCRCIEIDVWNGDEDDYGLKPPPRSKSPHDHKRHASSTSLPATAQSIVDKGYQKWHEMSGSSHYHSPKASVSSLNQPVLSLKAATDSATGLDQTDHPDLSDPADLIEPLALARAVPLAPLGCESSRSGSRGERSMARVEPVVMHAHKFPWIGEKSAQPGIPLREVCKAVAETAFEKNDLPVIVSLEVHATDEQQDMMVDIMKEEWGKFLLDEPFEGCDPKLRQPTLEQLRRKILIKVKKPSTAGTLSKGTTQLTVPTQSLYEDDASISEDERGLDEQQAGVPPVPKTLIREALGKLAVYTHSEHFKDFSTPGAKTPSHIFSVAESKFEKLQESRSKELFEHNRNFFMRAYPQSLSSKNFDPSVYWRKGVQMVAMNWQNWDEFMMLNSAMFDSEEGWALKPRGYRGAGTSTSESEAIQYRTLNLRITILAAQHIPHNEILSSNSSQTSLNVIGVSGPGLKPVVKCDLNFGRTEDRVDKPNRKGRSQEGELKLVTKSSETDHPDWGNKGHVLDFGCIEHVVEQLSFVRFKITDGKHSRSELAWACIRLDRLQQGYRLISLVVDHDDATEGKLLVKVEKTLR